MIVNTRLIPPGGEVIEGEEAPAIIDAADLPASFSRPIAYRLRVQMVGRTLVVRGIVQTAVRYDCSLCLEAFEGIIRVDDFSREVETAGEEIIDLTGDIREDIILAIPAKPLCREACRGLCPLCGRKLTGETCGCGGVDTIDSPFAGLSRDLNDQPKG